MGISQSELDSVPSLSEMEGEDMPLGHGENTLLFLSLMDLLFTFISDPKSGRKSKEREIIVEFGEHSLVIKSLASCNSAYPGSIDNQALHTMIPDPFL